MHKANISKSFISILLLIIAVLAFPGNASAGYASSCAGCHGSLASSDKKGSSASKIKSAIVKGTGGMGSLSGLTDADLNAIAVELGGSANLSVTPTPVVCKLPQVRDAASNTCITPACPTGEVRNAAGVCVPSTPPAPTPTCNATQDLVNGLCVPKCTTGQQRNAAGVCELTPTPPPSCDLPKKLVNGACTLTPVSCNDAAREYGREHKDDLEESRDYDDHDDKGKAAIGLVISNPGKQTIRAEQLLRLGVAASGDSRKIAIGANLPKGAGFKSSYNRTLQAQQGVLSWKVPKAMTGKTLKFRFCAKVHNGKGYGKKQDAQFVVRDVLVKVLPKLK
jgi:hypothetical protein